MIKTVGTMLTNKGTGYVSVLLVGRPSAVDDAGGVFDMQNVAGIAYCTGTDNPVMPNHIHLLITPHLSPVHLLESLKGAPLHETRIARWVGPESHSGKKSLTTTGCGIGASWKRSGLTLKRTP
jgi:hypothetical protein